MMVLGLSNMRDAAAALVSDGRIVAAAEEEDVYKRQVHHLSGQRLSDMQRQHRFAEQEFSVLLIGLNRNRAQLYRRIDDRVESMFARGVVEERCV